MDGLSLGPIALVALGIGICALGGLLTAWTAGRREGVDRAADGVSEPTERHM